MQLIATGKGSYIPCIHEMYLIATVNGFLEHDWMLLFVGIRGGLYRGEMIIQRDLGRKGLDTGTRPELGALPTEKKIGGGVKRKRAETTS